MCASQRILTTFWASASDPSQMSLSSHPYYMATRCGMPLGPMVARVAVRDWSMKLTSSGWVIAICERWLAMLMAKR